MLFCERIEQLRTDGDLALAYEIPNAFLTAQDEKNFNCYNTILLELLSVLATVLEFGPLLRHRKVLFITDCLALVAIFHNRRVPNGKNAAYALQALLEAAEEWHITLKVSTKPLPFPIPSNLPSLLQLKWKKRRSCTWTTAADILSHAAYLDLPLKMMPNLSFSVLQFPKPLKESISRASTSQPEDFACLRGLIQTHWREQGWTRGPWQFL